jgi:hypothetical protein
MALFTDGPIATIEELADHDGGVLEVANTESINLTRKLVIAQEEIGVELAALLPQLKSFDEQYVGDVRPLESVVVTAPLRLWHIYHTLELVYRDAYYNQLNDRYQAKWKEHVDLAKWAAAKVMETGVGMAADPVPVAPAPQVQVVNGSLAAGTYFVTVAWVNSRGEEGASPAAVAVAVDTGMTLQASVGAAPGNARGWNVYAGASADELVLQNGSLLDPHDVWLQPAQVSTNGAGPSGGQRPTYLRALPRVIQRG